LGTEALRKAKDGREFMAEITAKLGLKVEIISGAREAKLIAYGALSAMPEANGVVADLGGGSLELIELNKGKIGKHCSLPLGTLRAETAKPKAELAKAPWLTALKGRALILGGGSWRTLAKLYIRESKYPLDIVDNLTLPARAFIVWAKSVTSVNITKRGKWLEKDLTSIPYAAQLVVHLIASYKPDKITFTASGLREGALYSRLAKSERTLDPLIALSARLARVDLNDVEVEGDRLLVAAWLLRQTTWTNVDEILHLPVPGLPHGERVFVALAISKAQKLKPTKLLKACQAWMDPRDIAAAKNIGQALI
jgi:exopolyphosphatase/guanosine-5'-triphosphate,3'-diphosphate pyrophosphatase